MDNLNEEVLAGKIFVYPTDTIYGLGCNALNESAVQKIREIKNRDKNKPLSVIAPSIEWIKENFIIDINLEKYLPGPYTLILKKKNLDFLSHISDSESLGIRIPNSEFTERIQKIGFPFITTSVNISGEPFVNKISDIKPEILNKVDFIIYVGERLHEPDVKKFIRVGSRVKLSGKPSTLIMGGKEIKR